MCRRSSTGGSLGTSGRSTGNNVATALDLARELGQDAVVVTVACDTGLKYPSTDLYRDA